MGEEVLRIEDLMVHIPQEGRIIKAVDGISFSLRKEEVLGIVGESGSGKTMTALAIFKLLPPGCITKGRIIFNGVDIERLNIHRLRGKLLNMIFQDPLSSFNPTYTIGEQMIEVITHTLSLSKKQAKQMAINAFREVLLHPPERILYEYPHTLSGGMLQRVMIAQALVTKSSLLVADEPTSCLDTITQAQILSLLRNIQKKYKFAMILITHDLSIVATLAENICVMYKGKIVEYGKVQTILKNPAHPYTISLLKSIPSLIYEYGNK